MKFNLKNRPKWIDFVRGNDGWQVFYCYRDAVEEWFSGFEKELREMLRKYEFEGQNWELQAKLKEILGE